MSANYHIDENAGLIAVRIEGQVNLVDMLEQCKGLLADPQFDPQLPQLIDLRGMQLELEGSAARPFSSFFTRLYGPSIDASIAIVVDPNLNDELCARIDRLSCALDHTEVFDCYSQALKWLMKREFANKDTLLELVMSAQQPDANADHAHRSPE